MIRHMHMAAGVQRSTCPTLILGLGNILLRDEGVGVHVIRALEMVALGADVELFDGATAGMDLLDVLSDRERVVVVDAIDAHVEPGTILRLRPEQLLSGRGLSLHEAGLIDALIAARQMGVACGEVTIIGIRPFVVEWGLGLSAEMERLLPRLVAVVEMEAGAGLPRDSGVTREPGSHR